MALYAITDEQLTGIASAIRNKAGSASAMSVDEMPQAIENIPTGGGDTPLLVAWKELYSAEAAADAMPLSESVQGFDFVRITSTNGTFMTEFVLPVAALADIRTGRSNILTVAYPYANSAYYRLNISSDNQFTKSGSSGTIYIAKIEGGKANKSLTVTKLFDQVGAPWFVQDLTVEEDLSQYDLLCIISDKNTTARYDVPNTLTNPLKNFRQTFFQYLQNGLGIGYVEPHRIRQDSTGNAISIGMLYGIKEGA